MKLCSENAFSHLCVPDVFVHKGLLIEQRLPISTMHVEQVAFYVDHFLDLTPAVKEFVDFCCRYSFSDLQGCCYNQELSSQPIGRYDNIPFFITLRKINIVSVLLIWNILN